MDFSLTISLTFGGWSTRYVMLLWSRLSAINIVKEMIV